MKGTFGLPTIPEKPKRSATKERHAIREWRLGHTPEE